MGVVGLLRFLTTGLLHATLLQTKSQRALEEVQATRGVARVGTIANIACSVLPGAIERVHLIAPGLRFEGVWDVLSAAL